jgi:hypothetical protein
MARHFSLKDLRIACGAFNQAAPLLEDHAFVLVAGWGALGYLIGALCWTWCLMAADTWSKGLTILSILAWGIFAASTALFFISPMSKAGSWVLIFVSVGNGIGFVLLLLWLIAVAEAVIRKKAESNFGTSTF